MKRKRYTPEFKSQVVLEVLKEEKTMNEIASSHGIHVNQIRQWRITFLEQMPLIFAKENKKADQMKADYENQIENLYAEVGRLTEEIFIKHKIDEIYSKHPYFGSWRITVALNNSGLTINRKAVQRHMREMGIAGISPGPNLSKRNLEHRIYPYLLRNLAITHPNHVWGIDIAYIRLQRGWMYLGA